MVNGQMVCHLVVATAALALLVGRLDKIRLERTMGGGGL